MTNTTAATQLPSSKDVRAKLNYVYDDGKRPFLYARPRTKADPHSQDYGGSDDLIETWIRDGRQHDLSLDEHSFELAQQTSTKLRRSDFDSEKKIRSVYYKEVEDLVKQATGAARVVCFHHQVRDGTTSANGKGTKEYAYDVHTDSSPSSAEESFFDALDLLKKSNDNGEDLEQYKTGRFLFINAWRNISDTPIRNSHLAVCDESSLVKPDDYIAYDYFERDYASVHYKLSSRHWQRHRWYYFPGMVQDEVLLFKQFDSDPTRTSRMCFHASFADPTAPADAAPRQSIEVRAMAFFPQHQPNTCPDPASRIRVAVSKILLSVDYLHEWPRLARWWFADKMKKGELEAILDSLIQDKDNELGFKGEDPEFLDTVRKATLESGFADHANRAAQKLKGK